MKQIWLLTKVQLRTIFDLNINGKKNIKKYSLFGIFGVIMACFIALMVTAYCFGIGMALKQINMIDFLPTLVMVFSIIMMLLTSIQKVNGILFDFKDYDLIMSLPVKYTNIVISRLLLLYIYNILFSLLIGIPGMIVYGILGVPDVIFYVISFILLFIIPLIPIVLSSIIGLIVAIFSQRFKFSNIINMIVTIGITSIVIFGSFGSNKSEEALEMVNALKNSVYHFYPLARFYNLAVVEGSIVNLLLFVISSFVIFLLFSYVIGKNFKKVNTLMSAKFTKGNYKLKEIGTRSQLGALYQKEIKRYFSSSVYVLNTAFVVVLMTIACISLIFIQPEDLLLLLEMPEMIDYISLAAPFGVAISIGMAYISICSISLEGKNLWILKTTPVKTKTIFDSKILVNLTVTIPAIIIDGLILSIVLGFNLKSIIIQLLLPVSCTLFCSVLGVIINLKFPKLDWKNEVAVVKQSVAAFLGLFVGLIPILIIFLFYRLGNMIRFSSGLEIGIIIVFALTFLAYKYLNIKGSQIFYNLTE